tara:strand:+ start:1740 stop:2336 length:597 start_codon:yes stop_codon:yes gene_type:complete
MVKWTKKEETRLILWWNKGMVVKEIAAKIGRSVGSTTQKLYKLQKEGVIEPRRTRKASKRKPALSKKLKAEIKKAYENYPNISYPQKIVDTGKQHEWDKHMKYLKQSETSPYTETGLKISRTMNEINEFLIQKNNQYGDSVLQPIRIFSTSDKTEQIKVRIDDKLNRLMQGNASLESDEDVIKDLIGYLVLLLIQLRD